MAETGAGGQHRVLDRLNERVLAHHEVEQLNKVLFDRDQLKEIHHSPGSDFTIFFGTFGPVIRSHPNPKVYHPNRQIMDYWVDLDRMSLIYGEKLCGCSLWDCICWCLCNALFRK